MKSLSLLGKLMAQPLWAGTADAGSPPLVLAASVVLSLFSLEALRMGTRASFLSRHERLGAVGSARTLSFGVVVALRVLRSMSSAAGPVSDAMVLSLAREGGEAWGRQRFWGSASWGAGSVVVGFLIDRVGLERGLFGTSHVLSAFLLVFIALKLAPGWPRTSQSSVTRSSSCCADDSDPENGAPPQPLADGDAAVSSHAGEQLKCLLTPNGLPSPSQHILDAGTNAARESLSGTGAVAAQCDESDDAAVKVACVPLVDKRRRPRNLNAVVTRGAQALRSVRHDRYRLLRVGGD